MLKEIFSRQDLGKDEEETTQAVTCITYSIDGTDYYSTLLEVKEVVEPQWITPYPTPLQGHIGLVNLRGKVVPVLCPGCEMRTGLKRFDVAEINELLARKVRLIVFENSGILFAIMAEGVKKRSLKKDGVEREVIDWDGQPFKYFDLERHIDTEGMPS